MTEKIDRADVNGAGGGLQYAKDHADGGGFARPVDAQQTYDFAGTDVEGDALDGLDGTVVLAEVFHAKNGTWRSWRGVGLHRSSDAIIRVAGAGMNGGDGEMSASDPPN